MLSCAIKLVYALPVNNLPDPHGVAVQTHHVHTYSYHDNEELDESVTHQPTREVIEVGLCFLKNIGKHNTHFFLLSFQQF